MESGNMTNDGKFVIERCPQSLLARLRVDTPDSDRLGDYLMEEELARKISEEGGIKISKSAVHNWCVRGRVAARKVGRAYLIHQEQAEHAAELFREFREKRFGETPIGGEPTETEPENGGEKVSILELMARLERKLDAVLSALETKEGCLFS